MIYIVKRSLIHNNITYIVPSDSNTRVDGCDSFNRLNMTMYICFLSDRLQKHRDTVQHNFNNFEIIGQNKCGKY